MPVTDGSTVSIRYILSLDNDEIIDSNVDDDAPLIYTHGRGELITGLEQAMAGMATGETKKIRVEPEAGYGQPDPEALVEVPLDHLPPEAKQVGACLQAAGPEGQQIDGTVAELRENSAIIDFNHPLAGRTLHFEVTVLEISQDG